MHLARNFCSNIVLHLHRFQDKNILPFFYFISHFHGHLHDITRHRARYTIALYLIRENFLISSYRTLVSSLTLFWIFCSLFRLPLLLTQFSQETRSYRGKQFKQQLIFFIFCQSHATVFFQFRILLTLIGRSIVRHFLSRARDLEAKLGIYRNGGPPILP